MTPMSLDDFEAQLRGALDQQLSSLKQRYADGLAEARRQAAADAEREAAEKVEQMRAEFAAARVGWDAQLQDVTAAASAEAEHQVAASAAALAVAEQQVAGLTAARAEAEQAVQASQLAAQEAAELAAAAEQRAADAEQRATEAAGRASAAEQRIAEAAQREREAQDQKVEQAVAQATEALRRGGELELEAERRRAQTELEAAQQRAASDVEAERQRAQAEIDGLQQRMESELAAAKQAGASADVLERLLAATREIDGAQTLSHTLESLLQHAAVAAGRAVVFLIDGDRLKAWKAAGIPDADVNTVESSIDGRDLLARAIQTGQATSSGTEWPAPPFARLPAEGIGLAAPLMIGGRAVAVLYADSGANPPSAGAGESVEALVRHASAIVALRTAMRTLDVIGGAAGETAGGAEVSDDQGARRYARLLVSEIKLYNEGAVRDGRQQRDLRQRLRAEIDRAQRLYEERVPPAVGARQMYFQQELVQTLADGDATLLGSP